MIERRLAAEPIAIVGIAGLFPMAANYREYWQRIVDAHDCTSEVPATHWRAEDYYDPDPSTDPARPDTTYCTRGGFIPTTGFAPGEFGMPPNLLEVTTTVQLLSLNVARDVLRDAGAPGSDWYDPQRTGVVLGVTGPMPLTHPMAARLETPVLKEVVRSCGLSDADAEAIAEKYLLAFPPWEENTFPGLLGNVTAGRIANRLDLGGVNVAVDAACASSLSALRMAASELTDGRADLMIVGGCDTENTIFGFMCFSRTHALSKSGKIKPFDDSADGTLVGEGIGMMALKRLADARRDGDRVYAVVRGIGSSSDGRYGSIYAPRASGQELALRRAYADADCSPASVELFEGHATGTAVGDRTELTALGAVLGEAGDDAGYAAIGSVKSQIGHTKGAAGTASLIKLALGLHHKVLPPTINVETPNAAMAAVPALYLNTRTRPWIRDPHRPQRRAAASAMGFGGINFHVVLEEASGERATVLHDVPRAHVWHAPDPAALLALLRGTDAAMDGPVPSGHARLGFVARSAEEAASLRVLAAETLAGSDGASWSHPRGIHYRAEALAGLKVAALFAGQGSQYVDMGLTAACDIPPVGAAFDAANAQFVDVAPTLAAVVFPPPAFVADPAALARQREADLRRTEYAQPAIGALAAGQFAFLRELGLSCSAFLGHSFGELTALWAAGSLTDDDFFRAARARGAAMVPQPGQDAGAMAAVTAGRAEVEVLLAEHPGVTVCNDNAPDQVVVGGPTDAVTRMVEALGDRARALPVAAAFHTEAVGHAVAAFREALSDVTISAPTGQLISNTAGATYGADVDANRVVLAEQLRRPVEFAAGLQALAADAATVFVEFGPKQVLTGLVRRNLGDAAIAVATDGADSAAALMGAAVHLAVLGAPLTGLNRHAAAPFAEAPQDGMVVTLTGMTHRPQARTDAYRNALTSGYTVQAPAAAVPPAAQPVAVPAPAPQAAPPVPVVANPAMADPAAAHMELHTRYLDSQLRIVEGLVDAVRSAPSDPRVLAAVDAVRDATIAISRGHAHANDVLAAMTRLGNRDGPAGSIATASTGHAPVPAHAPAPLAPSPAVPALAAGNGHTAAVPEQINGHGFDVDAFSPAPVPSGVDGAVVRAALLAVVAEKTGYPVEMIDPAMDLESDLGIDSIKRVQILGAVAERVPGVASVGPEQLAELRSVDDIVGVLAGAATGPVPSGVDGAVVRAALLAVVAEKTGYPVEMIDPAMDLESDLGIDSIKRVQILGAVAERVPGVASVGPEQLAELRSVDDIVGVLAGAATGPVPSGVDGAVVRAALLAVVAEKTGYPVEMIDPAMDLESDLGIDSIKRVQILGAVAERVPGVASVGPEQLAELRSVDDIVGVLAGGVRVVVPVAAPRRSEIVLAPLPVPDRLDNAYAAAPTIRIVEIGASAPAHLIAALDAAGWTVRHAAEGPLDACLVVLGAAGGAAAEAALADSVMAAAGAIRPLAATAARGTRAAFVTLTRLDGGLGHHGGATPDRAVLGGVTGLVKTFAREAPAVFARALDVDPALDDAAVADIVLAELHDADLHPEVGVDAARGRWTPVLVDRGEAGLGDTEPRTVGPDDVVLVTGGARGITALCAVALAERSGANFLLLGRTPLTEEPDWAAGVRDSELKATLIARGDPPREIEAQVADVLAQREIRATLAAIGRSRYLAADVTDADAVRAALAGVRVTVVVHGAGVLADAALADKTPDGVRRVLAPKLTGLRSVLAALDAPPARTVLFGSVAGVLGNPGQADYAAANEALDRVAASLRRLHGPGTTCMHWGAWDGGMVTPVLKELFTARGVALLAPEAGAAAFVEQLAPTRAAQRSVLIGPSGPLAPADPEPTTALVARRDVFPLTRDPVIDDHRVGAHPVLPFAAAMGWMARVAEQAHRDATVVALRDVEVHRGIVLDGTEPPELALHLDPGLRASIRSSVPHFGATLELGRPAAGAPGPAWPVGEGPEDGPAIYTDAHLFHGFLLQGIRRVIERAPTRLVVDCRLPDTPVDGGAWASRLHSPVLGDVVLQAACVLGVWYLDAGCLPLSVGRIDLHASLPDDEPFVVVVDELRPGNGGVTVNAAAYTPAGTLLQRFTDITAVSTPEMAGKFVEAVARWSR